MNIAIASTGKSLDSRISLDFGRAPFFLIIDQYSMEMMALANPHTEAQPCAGILVAKMLAKEGVKLVIAELCGERTAQALQMSGIKLTTGAKGNVREIFERYKQGLLLDRAEPISCNDCELIELVTTEVIRLLEENMPATLQQKNGELTVKSNTETTNSTTKTENHQLTIAIASGKGGTGKTLVATSLALASDEDIQFLDCDVEEPNAYVFLKPQLQETIPVMLPLPQIDIEKCTGCGKCAEFCEYNALAVVKEKALVFSELCHSCGGCLLVCPEDAISETTRQIGVVEVGEAYGMPVIDGVLDVGEAIAPPIINAVKAQAKPNLITIIDSPPGTACPMIEAVKGSDYCVLVTEPTPFGYHDLTLAIGVVRELEIPFSVIINRAPPAPAYGGLVGDDKVRQYCEAEKIDILMQIPMDRKIAETYSDGIPLVEALPEYREKFTKLLKRIAEKEGGREK